MGKMRLRLGKSNKLYKLLTLITKYNKDKIKYRSKCK